MKAIFRNKRLTTGAIAIMVGVTILLAGIAFAWFTSSGSSTPGTVTMGTLIVEADFLSEDFVSTIPLYPGMTYPWLEDLRVSVQSKGTLAALAQLDLNAVVTLAGAQEPKASTEAVIAELLVDGNDDDLLPLGLWLDANDPDPTKWATYIWMYDEKDPNVIYVSLDGNRELEFGFSVVTVGEKMGNEYQGAKIDVNLAYEGVQMLPDAAITAAFPQLGANPLAALSFFPGFEMLDPVGPITIASMSLLSFEDQFAIYVDSLEGAFKDLVVAAAAASGLLD